MDYLVIKSNHGNHTGFNRKWEVLDEVSNISDAQDVLTDAAFRLSDDIIADDNGLPYDTNSKEIVYDGLDSSFNYDGRVYMFITKEDEHLFNGGSYGYQSTKMKEFFNQ